MENIIEVSNLYKSFGHNQVLKGINIEVTAGQIIGYIGPNGAGKSTTVKILCGLDGQFEGQVTVNGIDIKKDPIAVKRIIGYVPEVAEMYDVLTPLEFLKMIGQLHGLEANVIAKKSKEMLNHFGLSNHWNNRMNTFSKGMRQKVLIISGLIHNPKIIFLDEPLTGLDANTVIMVKEIISKLAEEGKTIFYSSHMMDIVEKVSNRILLINNGKIVANGTFDSLREEHGDSLENVFAKLTGDQDHTSMASNFLESFND